MMLLLKLTLAPLLVAAATLAARRWGPRIGGLLMGLPLTTGPIFLLLAIGQGPQFAAGTTVGILFGLVGLAAFAVAYAAASNRTGWAASLTFGAAAFFASSAGARRLGGDVVVAGLAAWAALALAASLMRRPEPGVVREAPPWWDLWVRMLAVAALTLATTAAATRLGPVLSGIVGTYPVAITVVMTFTHAQLGRDAALAMLRGSVLSWIAFASCFLVIGLSLEALGLAAAIGLGMLAAVATAVLVLWTDRVVASASVRCRTRACCCLGTSTSARSAQTPNSTQSPSKHPGPAPGDDPHTEPREFPDCRMMAYRPHPNENLR
jgi:hypothetical protein